MVGGDWNMTFIFPFSWEYRHPNWRTHIFQRVWNNQPDNDVDGEDEAFMIVILD